MTSPSPDSTPAANTAASSAKSMDAIMSLCKRRGFIYQASEIYGGINGFWDYGPMGAQLKKNLRDAWWQDIIMLPCGGANGPDGNPVSILPLETCIIQHPKVWEASGHLAGFNDPMVDDKETKQRFRADHFFGAFPGQRFESVSDAIATRRMMVDPRTLPRVTVVASTVGEAVAQMTTDKKLQRQFNIKAVELASDFNEVEQSALVQVTIGTEVFVAELRAVDQDLLREVPEKIPSPFTGKTGQLTEPKQFNLMFFSYTGAVFNEDNKVYLRPETAQGIFVQFKNVVDTNRVSVPFGIANIGKSFRNEVTPRNFTFRSREFEQMELEFFCHADQARDWYAFWKHHRLEWWKNLGLAGENLRLRDHETDELAHYAKAGAGVCDIEYRFPFTAPGFGELEGVAHRGNFDLTQHEKHSGAKMKYYDTTRGELLPNGSRKGEWYTPDCIEPAAGLDRGVLAILCEAYTKDESRPSPEFLKLHPRLAPIKAAVFPLVNKDGMPEVAAKLHAELVKKFGRIGMIETDAKQSIGKRYARMDEVGCPWCFTIDGDTLTQNTVTARDRDSGAQHRIALDAVSAFLADKLDA